MRQTKLRRELFNGQLSRRDMLKKMSSAGLVFAAMPMMRKSAFAATEQATYFTWGGYDDEGLFGPYIEKHGVAPNFATYGDAEEGFTKVKAGYVVDIIHPCANDVPRWRESGVFQSIDTNRLSNFGGVFPRLAGLNGANEGGQWFMPFEWGATSITYRTDLVEAPANGESWNMLFDEKYKGKIAVIDGAADTWYCMAILAGVDIGKALSEEDIEKTNELMKQLRPQVRMFTNDMTSLAQSMASGEVAMAITWNETPVLLAGEGHSVKFASPKEGALTWCCGLMMHKDAPNPDLAYDIIDAMLAPETGKYIIEDYGYGHSNADSFALVDAEVLANLGLDKDPEAYLDAGMFGTPQSDEIETRINRDFETIKTGF
ncbi:MAG: extracellular solute-binding protein [Gammaproteobacteria bacterium]|nr:extracellular solute-binding protein [Gammaproteobacteria bacterium]